MKTEHTKKKIRKKKKDNVLDSVLAHSYSHIGERDLLAG